MALYTTAAAIAKRLGQDATDLRTDDAPDTLDDCVAEASSLVDSYLLTKYDAADLAASTQVGYAARAVAAYYVCVRRGGPPPASVEKEYERYVAWLEKVAAGQIVLPGAGAVPAGPGCSNQRVDFGLYPPLRVQRPESTPAVGVAPRRYDLGSDATQTG